MAETTEGGGRSGLWSREQKRQLQALNILPFDLSDSNAYLYRCCRDSADFEENMRGRVEVGTAFDVCGEEYYSRLRQAGKLPKPVDACSRDQLLLVQRYAAIYQEDEEPALVTEERLGEWVVHNHGFWPMKEMPYIVARPTAIILPEMGLHDTCTLLDVYELDNFGDCPDAIPQYAKDLMLCRLFVMKESGLLTNQTNSEPRGTIIFGKVNVSGNDLNEHPRVPLLGSFQVTLTKSDETRIMFTWMQLLSLHYLGHILPEFPDNAAGLGIEFPELNPDNSDEFPMQSVWNDDSEFDYKLGKVLIRRKDGKWGRIFKQRVFEGEVQYGVSWDKESFETIRLTKGQRVKFYSVDELNMNTYVPPVCFPVHPRSQGEMVMVMGLSHKRNENRTFIRDYTKGITVSDRDRSGFIQCKLEREDGFRLHTLSADRFLVLDADKYVQEPGSFDESITRQNISEVYKFDDLDFADIKALFEITEQCDLVHTQKKGMHEPPCNARLFHCDKCFISM